MTPDPRAELAAAEDALHESQILASRLTETVLQQADQILKLESRIMNLEADLYQERR